jgi:transposase
MLINPKLIYLYKKSRKVHNPKNDNLDSTAICNYLHDNKTTFKPYTLISYHSESLKALSRERFSLVDELRKAKLNIYKLVTQIFPEFIDLFSDIYSGSAIEILDRYPSPKKVARAHLSTINSLIHKNCKTSSQELIDKAKTSIGNDSEHLSFLLIQGIKKLKSLESQINEYDESIKKYVDLINPIILTIPGISYITAGLILGEIGDITRFRNSDSLISYAGLDIEVYESGKYKATNKSISKKGSRYLRYALYQVAKVIWRYDPSFNKYYQKKQSENKHYYVILGHIQTKVVKVIYSVLKTNQPYTPR